MNQSKMMWRLEAQSFMSAKDGASIAECEDATAVNEARRRYAIADGATEAFDAGSWARALVQSWAAEDESSRDTDEGFRLWARAVGERWESEWSGRELAWYAEAKREAGSFAAFAGVVFDTDEQGLKWRAVALGDACVIHRRGNVIVRAMPIDDARKFNATPQLVPSRAERHADVWQHLCIEAGEARDGDVLLLLTDAAAAWYLRLFAEADSTVMKTVTKFENALACGRDEELNSLIDAERRAGRLRDDDVAAVRIEVGSL
ncbi:MAG: protein phosphatase 2C domain-containing protein [Pyrinomonadaceae bacterium MAG19_C2-C3]|nr:protein phosphatase 2C domain-containing protein [Pyrinomonadaceae bacterium MAG19_C2-C3]